MLRFLAIACMLLAPLAHADTYSCVAMDATGKQVEAIITYDPDTLQFSAEGASWSLAGHVTRQVSKTTGQTFLTFPASYSLSPITIELKANQDTFRFELSGEAYSCKMKQAF